MTRYAGEAEPLLSLDHKLHQDPEGPVEILERFWTFETDDKDIVPLPLVYADLLVIGDARCLEVAALTSLLQHPISSLKPRPQAPVIRQARHLKSLRSRRHGHHCALS